MMLPSGGARPSGFVDSDSSGGSVAELQHERAEKDASKHEGDLREAMTEHTVVMRSAEQRHREEIEAIRASYQRQIEELQINHRLNLAERDFLSAVLMPGPAESTHDLRKRCEALMTSSGRVSEFLG